MKKLEIKHIAPYLPYGLKIKIPKNYCFDGMETTATELILHGIHGDYIKFEGVLCFYPINHFKPILRPLSDLTKEIEHNGDNFYPIQELFQIAHESIYLHRFEGVFEDNQVLKDHLALKCHENILGADYNYGFTIELPYHFLMSTNGAYMTIPNFDMYEKLYEWHFDVFGLIEKGLAVDINTLKNKTYDV